MKTVSLTNDQYWEVRHLVALGASAVAANYANSLIARPYRTRGAYLKALAVVKYDRAYDRLATVNSETATQAVSKQP
jgi:hypothetical protein